LEKTVESQTVLRVENLTKRFTGVIAVNDVSLEINNNEIHAIIGENGAGKSTLCKLLTGVYQPDGGQIELFGKKVEFSHPSDSLEAGIGMVYQERNLVPFLTGAENICLGNEPQSKLFIYKKKIKEESEDLAKRMGFHIPLHTPVEQLGAGVNQLIEILRSFYRNPQILILDEPTASLGQGEVEPFLDEIIRIKEETGVSVVFISHKIEEVFKIADRITVMVDGKKAMTVKTEETCIEDCVSAMIRKSKIDEIHVPKKDRGKLEKILELETLTFEDKKHNLPMNVHLGEVVGIYGLVGSGRTETMEALYGIRPAEDRHFTFNGEEITKANPEEMIHKGMVMTPEKRNNGEFFGLNLIDNVCNLFLDKLSSKIGMVNSSKMRDFAVSVLDKNEVKYRSAGQNMSELSGGNKQKVIIGRSIAVESLKLLILDEPTAGLDLGAKHEIYVQMRELVDKQNKGIIFISSELEELLGVCDRIYVYFGGDVAKEFLREDFDKEAILTAALKGDSNGSN
jgi:ABC-type sugar transport system ATPase subunit